MVHARSRTDWTAFEPGAIPTKPSAPQVSRWLDTFTGSRKRALDVGAGAGATTRQLVERGFDAVGVDISAAAIAHSQRTVPEARFYVRDVAAAGGLALDEARFDLAVCQLVASVVGDAEDQARLVANVRDALVPAGALFISFSGMSNDVNEAYAQLYARDLPDTGRFGTYWSRDAAGRALYRTHHFSEHEIYALLAGAGFYDVTLEAALETSSRRPNERARFFYASCRSA